MKKINSFYKSLLVFCLLSATTLSVQLDAYSKTDSSSIESIMSPYYKKNFNGVILVSQNGKIIYEKANGFADYKNKKALTNNSAFNLASVSKQFTAMAIMILQQQGKLSYDDAITKYLPELSYKNITVKNLVYHTSGLDDYLELVEENLDTKKTLTNKDIIALFAKKKSKLLFTPGAKYEYSNTGYAFLASIIEKASGKTFDQFVTENIFKPANMANSFVCNEQNLKSHSNTRVYGYELKKNNYKSDDLTYLDGIVGDGGIYSTVEDLLKWDQALYTEKLVKKSNLEQGLKSGILNNGKKTNYAFGWEIIDGTTFFHNGSWAGFRTSITRYLDKKIAVIILTNNGNEGLDKIEQKIEDHFYK